MKRRGLAQLGRQLGRDDRAQLDDRVAAAALDPAGPHDDAGLVEGEVRRVEEEHLARLRLDRVERQARDRRPVARCRAR